jgi:uncharacterized protein
VKVNHIDASIARLDWQAIHESLWARGYALTDELLSAIECRQLISLYPDDSRFRSHIVMARYRFGRGDYKYFNYPLPQVVEQLRTAIYPHLATLANAWNEALGDASRFPPEHSQFLGRCHKSGQKRPTPLLLHYEAGDYNCLHQDLYGDIAFPLQITCFLSDPGSDYRGGEFVMVEQQPRAQSRAEVINPSLGQAVIFSTRYRPVKGTRGFYRVNMKHGVSRVQSGKRFTLGIIFHDAA